jgi:hypothetical protein
LEDKDEVSAGNGVLDVKANPKVVVADAKKAPTRNKKSPAPL